MHVLNVEKQFEVDIPDERAAEVRTVGDALELLANLLH